MTNVTAVVGTARQSPTNGRFVAPLPAEIKTRYSRMERKKKTASCKSKGDGILESGIALGRGVRGMDFLGGRVTADLNVG